MKNPSQLLHQKSKKLGKKLTIRKMLNTLERTTTLGGGCFWCIEAFYKEVSGIKSVVSGYAGGHVEHPTY